jgi:uncharacterized protein (TIGR03790 family)
MKNVKELSPSGSTALALRPDAGGMVVSTLFSFWLLVLVMAWPGRVGGADLGTSVVVIYNARMPESKAVAEYYARRRQVPADQLFGFNLPTEEIISRREFIEQLQEPLLAKLEDQGLFTFSPEGAAARRGRSATAPRRLLRSKIRYAAICYGVPVKIKKDESLVEKEAAQAKEELQRNEASVDSQLACLPLEGQKPVLWTGPMPNPAYGATNTAFLDPTNGVLMVTRLDGPSAEIARGLVDKAIQAETNGFWGRAYFDARGLTNGGFKLGDDWIRASAQICRNLGFETELDEHEATFGSGFPLSHAVIYAGWYDWTVSGPFARPTVEFMPGAIAYHLHSFSANILRTKTDNWVGPLLLKGATATMGNVYEPYLAGTPNLPVFFSRLLYYRSSYAEAAYASLSALSWQSLVVGDPLYRPYLHHPVELFQALEKRHSDLIEWYHLQVVNLNLVKGFPLEDCIAYLIRLPILKTSAVLTEKLANLYWDGKQYSSALATFETALARHPSPPQKLRLLLRLAHLRSYYGPDAKAIASYQTILKDYPDYPDQLAVYQKMLPLARNESNQELVEQCEKEIKRLSPSKTK